MSLFVGCYAKGTALRLNPWGRRVLKFSTPNVDQSRLTRDHVSLVHFDIGAFQEEGIFDAGQAGFCAVAGNPLFAESNEEVETRPAQLETIFFALLRGDWNVLNKCRGNFSLACYMAADNSLVLASDANGSRPLYLLETQENIYFGGSLSMIQILSGIASTIDLLTGAERYVFGVPLGDKSLHGEVKVLRNGEVFACKGNQSRRFHYFRWDELPEIEDNLEAISRRVYKRFHEAVQIRATRCSSLVAFLSGGLDSRCVVSVLQQIGKFPVCFNFYKKEEKDYYLAKAYAAKTGIQLHQIERPKGKWSWGGLMQDALRRAGINADDEKKAWLVFSGDGGSVGLGRVYLDEESIAALRDLGPAKFAKHYIEHVKVPPLAYLHPRSATYIKAGLISSMAAELSQINTEDPGRRLVLFYIVNDQRRHLHDHYEHILDHRIELMLPFMDRPFYELVLSAPTSPFLYHRFYHDWLRQFPQDVTSVPWQTYPGHLPCPIARSEEEEGQDQWSSANSRGWKARRLKTGWHMLNAAMERKSVEPVSTIRLKKGRVLSAALLHITGTRDYEYVSSFLESLGFGRRKI